MNTGIRPGKPSPMTHSGYDLESEDTTRAHSLGESESILDVTITDLSRGRLSPLMTSKEYS